MIIDIHAHLWANSHIRDKEILRRVLKQYNVDKIYISTLAEFYPTKELVKEYNAKTLEFMKELPDVIGGFVYVDPVHDNAVEVLKKGIDDGMSGVKIWVSCFCDDHRVDAVAKECIKYNIPLLVHAFVKAYGQLEFETTGIHVRNLAKRFPKLKIIMAHFGGSCHDGLRCIEDLKNVYSDFSGTLYSNDEMRYAIDTIGIDRILFGSDLPTGFIQCVGQVEGANLKDEDKEKIYYKNALKILGRDK